MRPVGRSKGEIKFNDKRWEKLYTDWLSNIKDWCISRQIWWGHKIPIDGVDDVLDTWFSSALWPFATLGWPDKNSNDLKEFYPTQVLSTARDIINLWVARMIFSGIELMNEKPFSNIIIHPTILAKDGRRMSKSLGTGIDPLILIDKYGADATRFGLIYQMMGGQDIKFDESHLLAGKKFANKLWNIARFVLQQTSSSRPQRKSAAMAGGAEKISTPENKEILEKLNKIIISTSGDIENYDFGQALHTLYDFVWHEYADKYIEYAKTKDSEKTKEILLSSLLIILKLLHPFMPFITEEIWSMISDNSDGKKMLIIEEWPKI